MNKLVITLDIDWSPDIIIQYAVDLLGKYHIKSTIFATHESALIKSLEGKYEVGIHPNFTGNDYGKTIKELKSIYPGAIGSRSHALFQSSSIFRLLLDNGIKYDSSTYLPLMGVSPFTRLHKLVCIPFFMTDDDYFSGSPSFELSDLRLDIECLKVYTFHPIHIYMNTMSVAHYLEYKPFYQQPDRLEEYRNRGEGAGALFKKLLKHINQSKLQTCSCKDIYEEYVNETKIIG